MKTFERDLLLSPDDILFADLMMKMEPFLNKGVPKKSDNLDNLPKNKSSFTTLKKFMIGEKGKK
jgi:hypothetical protein